MRIAIYGRAFDDNFNPYIQQLFDRLLAANVELLVLKSFYAYMADRIQLPAECKLFTRQDNITDQIDCVFSIGGDGTMLDTLVIVRDSGIPVLGINTGRLGFLSSTAKDQIDSAIDAVLAKNYRLDPRAVLHLEQPSNLFPNTPFALNELTVHKKDTSSMVTIHAYIDDVFLNSYWADGLIISTPTGSSAYNLSCGGPIVVPGSNCLVITPIAPHNLTIRPVVIPDNVVLRLRVEGRGRQFLASLDSRSQTIDSSSDLIVKRAAYNMNLIELPDEHFLNTMRNKLMWGLDKRN